MDKVERWRRWYKRRLERKLGPGHSEPCRVFRFYSKCKGKLLGVLSKRMSMIPFHFKGSPVWIREGEDSKRQGGELLQWTGGLYQGGGCRGTRISYGCRRTNSICG